MQHRSVENHESIVAWFDQLERPVVSVTSVDFEIPALDLVVNRIVHSTNARVLRFAGVDKVGFIAVPMRADPIPAVASGSRWKIWIRFVGEPSPITSFTMTGNYVRVCQE